MTREEAKEVFINRGYVKVKGGIIFDGDKWRQSVEVITEWLKQQPCEDAISRQVVLDKIKTEIKKAIWEDVIVSIDGTDETRIPRLNLDDVLEIIDKYKAESEE